MKLLALAVIAAIATAGALYQMNAPKPMPNPIATAWNHWRMENGRSYGTDTEQEMRYHIFSQNYLNVNRHNAAGHSWKLALNNFADMTSEEVAKQYTGFNQLLTAKKAKKHVRGSFNGASKDWRDAGAVTAVKDQGQCGSCWAFSTTGSVEGANFVKNGSLPILSEQQLVDCDTNSDMGCSGGLMDSAFEYIEAGNSLETESDYPYTGRDGTCHYTASRGVGTVSEHHDVASSSDALREALDNHGPVSVAIEADQSVFQMYTSGVLTGSSCGTQLDHGVLAVGYGTEDGEDFFWVKNSWGSGWGDNGYIKIGADNVCGILSSASYPIA